MRNREMETATAVRGAVDEPLPISDEQERELREFGSATRKRRVRTHQIGSIRTKLKASAAGHVAQAAAQVSGRESEHISDSDYASFRKAVNAAIIEMDQEERLAEFEHHVAIVSEPPVYGPHSDHSWFRDLAATLSPEPLLEARTTEMRPEAVEERLRKHTIDVRLAVERGGEYGRAVRAMLRESCREENEHQHRQRASSEVRAVTSGGGVTASAAGGGGAAFVSPEFLTALWAPYRGVERSFADQCHKEPLPDYGLQVYIPVWTATDKVAKQADSGTVTEASRTTGLEGAKLETPTGQVIITQQLLDRAVTGGGGGFDELIAKELAQRLDQEVDLYALNTAIAAGEAVTGATEYKTLKLYEDIAKAREKLTDTAGTRLRPTHFFSTSDFYSYASRQGDANERPTVQPWWSPGFPISSGADDFDSGPKPKWSRFTGTILPAGLLWFTSDNIQPVGTTNHTQLIVSAPDVALVLVEGEPVVTAFRETRAPELEVIVNLRNYCACITRHAAGTSVISGGAYTTALV
jgi:hypothetical protein